MRRTPSDLATPKLTLQSIGGIRELTVGILIDFNCEYKEGIWISGNIILDEAALVTTLNILLNSLSQLEKVRSYHRLEIDMTTPRRFNLRVLTKDDYRKLTLWAENIIERLNNEIILLTTEEKPASPPVIPLFLLAPEVKIMAEKKEQKIAFSDSEYATCMLHQLVMLQTSSKIKPIMTAIRAILETKGCPPDQRLLTVKALLEEKPKKTGLFKKPSRVEKIMTSLKKRTHRGTLIFSQVQPQHLDLFKNLQDKLLCAFAYILRDINTSKPEINERINRCLMQLFQGKNQVQQIQVLLERAVGELSAKTPEAPRR